MWHPQPLPADLPVVSLDDAVEEALGALEGPETRRRQPTVLPPDSDGYWRGSHRPNGEQYTPTRVHEDHRGAVSTTCLAEKHVDGAWVTCGDPVTSKGCCRPHDHWWRRKFITSG